MIIGLQIAAIVFSLTMIYFAVIAFKKKQLDGLEIAAWLTIWIVTIIIVIFPEFLRTHAQTFAVSRLFDLMVVGGFFLVISIAAIVYTKTRKIEKKLEKYIRNEAIKSAKKKDGKSE